MKTAIGAVVALGALLLTAPGAGAHHSFAMFDKTVERVVTGTVARWAFNVPHSWLYLNVKGEDGTETLWSFEGSAPPSLLTRGINGSTFEPGDTVTISYCPLRDGRPGGGLGWARLADGTFVNPADGGCDGSPAAIEKWKGWLAAGYTSSTDAQPRGHDGRQQRHAEQQARGAANRHRVGRPQTDDDTGEGARYGRGPQAADERTDDHRLQRAPHDGRQHRAGPASQRQPDPDLPAAMGHDVHHDPGNADGRQRERQRAQRDGKPGDHARDVAIVPEVGLERHHAHRHVGIQALEDTVDVPCERGEGPPAPDHEAEHVRR